MAEIEAHLEGYYDKEDLEPGFAAQVKEELVEILAKYYPESRFSVSVFQLSDKKLRVAISPKDQCPECLNKKLWSYNLDTQPPTTLYRCECGWEGSLD